MTLNIVEIESNSQIMNAAAKIIKINPFRGKSEDARVMRVIKGKSKRKIRVNSEPYKASKRISAAKVEAALKKEAHRAELDIYTGKSATLDRQGSESIESLKSYSSLYDLRHIAKAVYPTDRVAVCGANTIRNTPVEIGINKSGNIRYSNLWSCGASWICPVCAYKTSKIRQTEIYEIIKNRSAKGKKIYFLTLTLRHSQRDSLAELIAKMRKSWEQINSGRKFRDYFKNIEFIKTIEVKKSLKYGWHPHYHLLLIMDKEYDDFDSISEELLSTWSVKTNSKLDNQVLKQANDMEIADYMAKFDISTEMTANHVKGGKGGYTYTQLLKLLDELGEAQYYAILKEYQFATKGVHQFSFSKKLQKSVLSEKEIASLTDDAVKILLFIDVKFWRKVIRKRILGKILIEAKNMGVEGVYTFFNNEFPDERIVLKENFITYE